MVPSISFPISAVCRANSVRADPFLLPDACDATGAGAAERSRMDSTHDRNSALREVDGMFVVVSGVERLKRPKIKWQLQSCKWAFQVCISEIFDHFDLSFSVTYTSTMSDAKLTKKQQKALAHRDKSVRKTKGKAKATDEPEALPEADIVEDEEVQDEPDKKRKREDDEDGQGEEGDVKETKTAKRRRKAREKKAAEAEAKSSRLIVFVGKWKFHAICLSMLNVTRQGTCRTKLQRRK
jgi:hypothetical protein